jgi:hypothetical protein
MGTVLDYSGVTDVTASVVSTTGTALNVVINYVTNRYLYVAGFEVTGLGATAAATNIITLANLVGPSTTFYYSYVVPAGVTTAAPVLSIQYTRPIQVASNMNAVLTVPAFGAGNTYAAANLHGVLV